MSVITIKLVINRGERHDADVICTSLPVIYFCAKWKTANWAYTSRNAQSEWAEIMKSDGHCLLFVYLA